MGEVKVSNNEVAAQLSEEAKAQQLEAARLRALPRETIIESVQPIWDGAAVAAVTDVLYDFEYLQLQTLWTKYGIRGQMAHVCVIDSGIDDSHVGFRHHKDLQKKSFISGNDSPKDGNGHGTWVCGKIAAQGVGIAPRCTLTSLRTLDDGGSGTVDDSTEALRWILDQDINIVNMSLGSPQGTPKQEKIINKLAETGVLVVAAAGNYNTDTPFYPGSYDKVLTVAATDQKEVKASFSNFGGQIDIAGPGVSCYGTYLNGMFRKMSGTSMATPIVTGLLALGVSYVKVVKGRHDRPAIFSLVTQALIETAKDLGVSGKDKYYGFGGINGPAFLEKLSKLCG